MLQSSVARFLTWRLPLVCGNVADLVTEGSEEVGIVHVAPAHASSSVS